jgi:AraC family transcriptional regulator, melibiose operon regulatory protein
MVSFDPNRPDFAPYGLTCVRWNPSPMRRPDHHNEVELNFLGTGWLTYLLGGRKVRIEAGRLNAFWAAIPHQIIDYGNETDYFVATIPLPWFLQCRLPDNLVQPLLQGQVIAETTTKREVSDYELFAQWEHDLQEQQHAEQLKKAVLLEMEARLLRLARVAPPLPLNGARKRHAPLSDAGLNKVEQMACLIAQRYTERLTVDEIGKSVKLHPNYAMNLFQKTFGTTLIEYLTQHRVSHAQRLLATSDLKVVDVAFSSGFSSISRFNDAFRRACGCSPREYRQQHLLEE